MDQKYRILLKIKKEFNDFKGKASFNKPENRITN